MASIHTVLCDILLIFDTSNVILAPFTINNGLTFSSARNIHRVRLPKTSRSYDQVLPALLVPFTYIQREYSVFLWRLVYPCAESSNEPWKYRTLGVGFHALLTTTLDSDEWRAFGNARFNSRENVPLLFEESGEEQCLCSRRKFS
jgi:hypothetical protein